MKRLYFLMLLLLLPFYAFATRHFDKDTVCSYDPVSGDFLVFYHGNKYKQSVDSDFPHAACDGGIGVAGLYDGDAFIIFDSQIHAFKKTAADDHFCSPKISAGRGIVALYDGDNFLVYDAKRGSFSGLWVDDNYPDAKLSTGVNVSVLYDGDELFAYDAASGEFESIFADDKYPFAAVIAGKDSALAYDGDDVFGYCTKDRRWISESAPNGVGGIGLSDPTGETIGLLVGNKTYTLDLTNCRINNN